MFTVLLVDDNQDHRFLTKRALKPLENEGRLRVLTAEDGEEAYTMLREGISPGLLLLDIKMPRRDGFTLLQDVRADAAMRDLRVVMFSSSENRADIERAKALGADDYQTKPLDARDFQEKVRVVVGTWLNAEG
jgi:CheY-like chemotaxis protein